MAAYCLSNCQETVIGMTLEFPAFPAAYIPQNILQLFVASHLTCNAMLHILTPSARGPNPRTSHKRQCSCGNVNAWHNFNGGRVMMSLSVLGARGFIRPNVRVLDDVEISKVAPSVFAPHAWGEMSSKYRFIPTSDVLAKMRAEGFQPVKVQQSRCRIEGKRDFTKHLIRFRRVGADLVLGEVFPEVVLVNSHDGASSFQCYSGLFRLVCLNGMVTGLGNLSEYRTRHSGEADNVIEAAYRVVEDFPQLSERVKAWQSVQLSEGQALAYADAARSLRWEPNEAPIEPAKLLTVRRRDDAGNSLWLTYQRTQENLIKGGLGYMAPAAPSARRSYRRMTTRSVNSVTEDVKLNRALWSLTEKMAELVKA